MTTLAAHTGRAPGRTIEPVLRGLPPVAVVAGAIVSLGAVNGGYFPTSWGWSALLFSWSALVALLVKRGVAVSRFEVAYVGALAGLLGWTVLSLLWTSTTTQTVYEVERTLSYVVFAAALPLLARRDQLPAVLGSVLVALTALSTYGLATRLLPGGLTPYDAINSYRLSEPLGYWNALAALSAFGSILALGFAATPRNVIVRGLASASLVVLVPTLYFTFGRGGWLALFLGCAALIAIDPKRLRFTTNALAVAPWPVLALWRSFESKGLTTDFSPLSQASNDGETLAWTLALLAVVAFSATVLFASLAARVSVGSRVRTLWAVTLIIVVLGATCSSVVALGGPSEVTTRALHSIRKSSPNVRGDQTKRLFSLSANGRLQMWSAALNDARAHPLKGSGAGTFEMWWLEHRTIPMNVRDAHSLHLEMLAELGVPGLLLLLLATALPLAAAVRARAHPYVPVAFATFVAFLGHAAVDWDWEMPAVTICGFTFAGCALIAARNTARPVAIGSRARVVGVPALLIASGFAFVAMTGNRALGQADRASDRADPAAVARYARTAGSWAPWSSEPIRLEADAALERGALTRARRLYGKAIAKDPRNWELWLSLALASDGPARSGALVRAAELNPLDPQIKQLRGTGM
jgi:O-Antigen ligase